jgi:hypothetical protein
MANERGLRASGSIMSAYNEAIVEWLFALFGGEFQNGCLFLYKNRNNSREKSYLRGRNIMFEKE